MKPGTFLGLIALVGIIAGSALTALGKAPPEYISTTTVAALSALAGSLIPRNEPPPPPPPPTSQGAQTP